MTSTTLSSLEFSRNTRDARLAAAKGPVFITDSGEPTLVLLSFPTYQRLIREHRNMAELLSVPDMANVDFEPVRSLETAKPADFS